MPQIYRKFLALLEKWPIDKSRPGRDLGEYLRKQLKDVLGQANIVKVNENRLDDQLQALERIANDTYLNKFPRKSTSSASGLTAEQLRQIRSEEFQRYLIDEFESKPRFSWFKRKTVSSVAADLEKQK